MTTLLNDPVVCPVFIGRADVLSSLEHAFAQWRQGHGQTILVAGEAGIGKSRLVAEAQARLGQEPVCCLQGACFPQDHALPFAPLVDVLRTLLLPETRATTLNVLAPFAPELVKILPELVLWLPEVRPTPALPPEEEKRRLFVVLTHVLLSLAEQRPLLLILEDLHWSDETSLEFLRFLIRQSRSHPFLLMLTYRSDEIHPALMHFLAALNRERWSVEFSLAALTIEEVQTMLRTIFRMKRPIRRDFLEALHELTEGNPFFVEEVLKSLLAAGEIFLAEGVWSRKPLAELHIPRSIHDAVGQRTSLLSEEARETLELAAVIGKHVDFPFLQALSGRSEQELLGSIETLIAAQLLVEVSAEQFTFRHALMQQAVYQGLSARKRRTLHLAIAQTMERLSASSREAHLSDLAYHSYQAQAWPETLAYTQRVGAQALALYAPHAALEHFTHALEAASHLPAANPIPLYLARGQAHEYLGNFAAAQRDFVQALEMARAAQDRQAEWQSLMALGMWWTDHNYTQGSAWFRQALTLAQEITDTQKYARSQSRLANCLINTGQPATAIGMLEETRALLQQQGDKNGVALALMDLALASAFSGDLQVSVSSYDQAIALFRSVGNKRSTAACLALRSSVISPAFHEPVFSPSGNMAACQQDLEEAQHLVDEIEWRAGQAITSTMAGWVFASYGDLGKGLAHARAALEIATEINNVQWMAGSSYSIGVVYLSLLDPIQAIAQLAAGLEIARALGSAFWAGNITASLAQAYIL